MKRESWWVKLLGHDGYDRGAEGARQAQRPDGDEQALVDADADADVETVERRAAVRLEAPLGQHDIVRFSLHGKPHESAIDDLSPGGVSFRLPRGEVALVAPGSTIVQATIERGGRRLVADLHVRSTRRVKSFLGGQCLHVGCRFGPLDEARRAELEAMLQDLQRGRA